MSTTAQRLQYYYDAERDLLKQGQQITTEGQGSVYRAQLKTVRDAIAELELKLGQETAGKRPFRLSTHDQSRTQ